MSYKLVQRESVGDGLRRIAIEQIESSLKEINASDPSRPETVHKFRRRCKKVRALIRLFRGELERDDTFRRENEALRDTAKSLGHVRDADVMIKTYDRLMAAYGSELYRPGYAPIRRALTMERRGLDTHFGDTLPSLIEDARRSLQRFRQRIDTWVVKKNGFSAIRFGLLKTYKRGWIARREAMRHPNGERLHEWRKRVKYHRNHLRLIGDVWPSILGPRNTEAEVLGELLGDEHDLAVLRDKVLHDHRRFGRIRARRDFIALIDRRRDELYREIVTLGARLYAEPPKQMVRNLQIWWKVWETEATPLLSAPIRNSPVAHRPAAHSALHMEYVGADGGNRTHTPLPEPDFESGASTSSATSALAPAE